MGSIVMRESPLENNRSVCRVYEALDDAKLDVCVRYLK